MKIEYSELATHYASLETEEFESIDRDSLADEAKPYYDREKARRMPGWVYQPPTTESREEKIRVTFRKSRRGFIGRSILWASLGLLVMIVSLLIPVQFSSTRQYIVGLTLVFLILGPFREQSLARRTGYVVLWLRRFQRGEQKPFKGLLNQASANLGIPITVQDSSARFSIGFAVARLFPFATAIGAVMLFLAFFSIPVITYDVMQIVFCLAFLVVGAASSYFGYLKLRPGSSAERLKKVLGDIRSGKLRSPEVLILGCDDSFWRSAIEMALTYADAVVIDVTELSENVIWELRTAAATMEPLRILLVCATDTEPHELTPTTREPLAELLGPTSLAQFPTFFYPKTTSRRRLYRCMPDLREALIKALAHAPAH
jgi:hypothetical protein